MRFLDYASGDVDLDIPTDSSVLTIDPLRKKITINEELLSITMFYSILKRCFMETYITYPFPMKTRDYNNNPNVNNDWKVAFYLDDDWEITNLEALMTIDELKIYIEREKSIDNLLL